MGCTSSSPSDEAGTQRSKELEKMLKEDEKAMRKHVKLLLLGAGASGKSTVLKQMRLINNVTFSTQEIEYYRQLVFQNLVNGMKLIIDAMDLWEMSVDSENRKYISLIDNAKDIGTDQAFPQEYRAPLEALWADVGVQKCYERANEGALPENMPYFFADIDRLFEPGFKPTQQDILRVRVKTSGMSETKFESGGLTYSAFDVGGQRSERRKWIACFSEVTAVLFVVALSGYDECLVEDIDSNQMKEALMLFDSISNSNWFTKTSMILFLNKDDIFREKVLQPRSQIRQYFPDYDGQDESYEEGRDYFKRKFARLSKTTSKEVYVHYTNATDTAMIKVVMAAVQGGCCSGTDDSLKASADELPISCLLYPDPSDTILRTQLRDMAMI